MGLNVGRGALSSCVPTEGGCIRPSDRQYAVTTCPPRGVYGPFVHTLITRQRDSLPPRSRLERGLWSYSTCRRSQTLWEAQLRLVASVADRLEGNRGGEEPPGLREAVPPLPLSFSINETFDGNLWDGAFSIRNLPSECYCHERFKTEKGPDS